jgi:anthranilate/para-aminobenzoate synthase component I
MKSFAKQLQCSPLRSIDVARALRGRPGLAVLASDYRGALRSDDARFDFVACDPEETCADLLPPAEQMAAPGFGGASPAPRWVGVVPYEAMRDIERPAWTRTPEERPTPSLCAPRWYRYGAVVRIDRATGRVVVEADDAERALRLERAVLAGLGRSAARNDFTLGPLQKEEPEASHVERVRAVLALIARGDVYQVNLARRLSMSFRGDPLEAFASFLDRAPAPFGFFCELGRADNAGDAAIVVCGVSPELALEVRVDRLRTAPIKGTRSRGTDAEKDRTLARELEGDPKERAELTMAIDLHRNDLGRVAVPGTVRLRGEPRVLAGSTVWSRACELEARRAAGVSAHDVVRAMLPCGSVTGAPKVRAMEVIARLEPHRRGLYTGAMGYVGRDGAVVLAMAIRTLEIEGDRAHYWTGGGIVADSDPERELEETRWKAAHLSFTQEPPTSCTQEREKLAEGFARH